MRPVLLRVLTDLYVQEAEHGPSERVRFAELACRLLDAVDAGTRAAVAERLAPHRATPPAVAAQLARDEIAVAGPILRRSPALSEAELHSILDSRSAAHAAAIAEREALPPSVAARLGLKHTQAAMPAKQRMTGPQTDPAVTRALARRFLIARHEERQLILTALPACPPGGDEERLRRTGRGLHEKLERAALRHRIAEFAALLRDHAGLPRDIAMRVAAEPSGEPLAAFCRALQMPFGMASRILLFLNSGSGGSVERVFAHAANYEAIRPQNALRLAAAWSTPGAELRPERAKWTRTRRERIDPRPAAVRTIRGVTPAQPASSNGS